MSYSYGKRVIVRGRRPVTDGLLPSVVNCKSAGQQLREDLMTKGRLGREDAACTVITGSYVNGFAFSYRQATDTRCCERGINSVLPPVRTFIGVQKQSGKAIRLNEKGQGIDFAVSQKCAVGGRGVEGVVIR